MASHLTVPTQTGQAPKAHHQPQPSEVRLGVVAIAVVGALRTGQDPGLLVPAHGRGSDTGSTGELGGSSWPDRTPSSHSKVKGG